LTEPFWIYVRIEDVYERVELIPRAIKKARRVCGVCHSDASVEIEVRDIWPPVAIVAIEETFSSHLHAATHRCLREHYESKLFSWTDASDEPVGGILGSP